MGVFAIALLVRLLFLAGSADRGWPHSVYYEGDAPEWVRWANALDRGEQYEFDLPLRSPAVAYLLHWMLPGQSHAPFTSMKILWCVLSAGACALAYLGFRRAFSRSVSLFAAILCAFSFGSYITATSLNNETLYAMSLMAIVLATLQLLRKPAVWIAVALGLLHGAATLIRPEHTLLLLMLLAYMAWHWRGRIKNVASLTIRDKALYLAFVLISSIAVCLPWSVRGWRAIHRYNNTTSEVTDFTQMRPPWTPEAQAAIQSLPAFARQSNANFIAFLAQQNRQQEVTRQDVDAFFATQFGYTPEPFSPWVLVSMKGPLDFALANHPYAHGAFSKAALAMPGETDPIIRLARPDHTRLINHGYQAGWNYITSDFGTWLKNVRGKLSSFSQGVASGFTALNLPFGREGVRRPVDVITPRPGAADFIWQPLIFALLGFGIILAAVRKISGIWLLIILYKLVVAILFYGYVRQAISILPAFYIFMALAIDQIGRWLATSMPKIRRCGFVSGISLLSVLLLIEVWAFFSPPRLRIDGALNPAPQWGAGAFESNETITIEIDSNPPRSIAKPASP